MDHSAPQAPGLFKVFSAAFHVVLTVFLFLWVKRGGLSEKYGLFLPRYRAARAWFFLPLAAVCLYKVCFSPALRHAPGEAALWVVSMLGVGFLEELIFRGFLFRMMLKSGSAAAAVIVSSVTFGIGHILNLLSGQTTVESVIQVFFAVAWGFLFTMAAWKSGSLWPGIIVHALVDVFSKFAVDNPALGWVYMGATILGALIYCPYLAKLKAPETA